MLHGFWYTGSALCCALMLSGFAGYLLLSRPHESIYRAVFLQFLIAAVWCLTAGSTDLLLQNGVLWALMFVLSLTVLSFYYRCGRQLVPGFSAGFTVISGTLGVFAAAGTFIFFRFSEVPSLLSLVVHIPGTIHSLSLDQAELSVAAGFILLGGVFFPGIMLSRYPSVKRLRPLLLGWSTAALGIIAADWILPVTVEGSGPPPGFLFFLLPLAAAGRLISAHGLRMRCNSRVAEIFTELSGDGLVELDRGGRILWYNRRFEQWTGVPIPALLRQDFTGCFLEREPVRHLLSVYPGQTETPGLLPPLRSLLITGDGGLLPLSVAVCRMPQAMGGFLVVCRDMEEIESLQEELRSRQRMEWDLKRSRRSLEENLNRNHRELAHTARQLEKAIIRHRQTESALRESEVLYQTLIHTSPAGVTLTDLDGRILLVNPRAAVLCGAQHSGQLTGRKISEFVPPGSWEASLRMIRELFQQGSCNNIELELLRMDRSGYAGRIHGAVIRAADGAPLWLLFVHEDVTEVSRYRKLLEAFNGCLLGFGDDHRRNLRLLLELVGHSLGAPQTAYFRRVGANWRMQAAVPAVELELRFGKSTTALLERGIAVSLLGNHPDAVVLKRWNRNGVFTGWQLYPVKDEGLSGGVLLAAHNGKNAGSPVDVRFLQLVCAAAGIEDCRLQHSENRKKLEAQIIQAQRFESLGTLAGGMAHEINNPLTGILNYAQLLVQRADRQNAEQIRLFGGNILEEGERIAAIVGDLMNFAGEESGGFMPFDLNSAVRGVLHLAETVFARDSILIHGAFDESLPPVSGDRVRLRQALMNLIINSVESIRIQRQQAPDSDPHGPDIHIETGLDDGWVTVRVADRGTGVGDGIKERIFEPFFSTKTTSSAPGLGLAAAYGIIHAMGGTICMTDVPGWSAVFLVSLPPVQNVGA